MGKFKELVIPNEYETDCQDSMFYINPVEYNTFMSYKGSWHGFEPLTPEELESLAESMKGFNERSMKTLEREFFGLIPEFSKGSKGKEECSHTLVEYRGFTESYNYCKQCGKKESEL